MLTSALLRRSFAGGVRRSLPVFRGLSGAAVPSDDENLSHILTGHPYNNVPVNIARKVGENLHLRPWHPLCTIKSKIEEYFALQAAANAATPQFQCFDDLAPLASVKNNFDDLLTAPDHVSRKQTDTYYVDSETVLRTHTSAHQSTLMAQGLSAFLCTGDVYRRDEIDRSHYPVFHQMEGVRVFDQGEIAEGTSREESVEIVKQDLQRVLEGLVDHLFGDVEKRWVEAYFPFTDPSIELEIFFDGEWLEVLGCGVVEQEILRQAGRGESVGWAFGLGLERLAMVLFSIQDIRLFWSDDPRFMSQFEGKDIVTFVPYSKYPPCFKDISFWLPDESVRSFHENDLCDLVRLHAGDLVEQVELIDEFTNPKTGKVSNCFRITYRSMDRSLTNDEIDRLQSLVRDDMESALQVELR